MREDLIFLAGRSWGKPIMGFLYFMNEMGIKCRYDIETDSFVYEEEKDEQAESES